MTSTVQYTKVIPLILPTSDHCTGHVYLITKHNDMLCVIVGHNTLHNNAASLGGFKKGSETLLETIYREFSEETLDCLMPTVDLGRRLEHSTIITRRSDKGQHYTAFIDV